MDGITGSCHCGHVGFRIEGELPERLTRCTCSFCAKRGALLAYYPSEAFHLTALPENDAVYRWNTRLVAHHFCAVCGCATFSDSPAFQPNGDWDGETRRIGVNARLFAGLVAEDLPVDVIDGKHLW